MPKPRRKPLRSEVDEELDRQAAQTKVVEFSTAAELANEFQEVLTIFPKSFKSQIHVGLTLKEWRIVIKALRKAVQ